jgi:hypothetical protein
MKIKMEVIYGDELCEALKETFGCDTDEEFLVAFKAIMKAALAKETTDPNDISISVSRAD